MHGWAIVASSHVSLRRRASDERLRARKSFVFDGKWEKLHGVRAIAAHQRCFSLLAVKILLVRALVWKVSVRSFSFFPVFFYSVRSFARGIK